MTCSSPRAGSTHPSGCGRWRSGAGSARAAWPSCSARARSPPTRSSAPSTGAAPPSATSPPCRTRPAPSSTRTRTGVNAFLDGHPDALGLVFVVAGALVGPGHRPRRPPSGALDPIDTLTWAKVQAWGLGGNMDSEIFRMLADAQLGDPALTDQLFPAYAADQPGHRGPGGPGATAPAAPAPRSAPRPSSAGTPRWPRTRAAWTELARIANGIPALAGLAPEPRPGRRGRRRLQQLGRRPVALDDRRRAPRQRPPPRLQHAVGLVRQRPPLPARLGRLPVRRRGRRPSPARRASSRATTAASPGA